MFDLSWHSSINSRVWFGCVILAPPPFSQESILYSRFILILIYNKLKWTKIENDYSNIIVLMILVTNFKTKVVGR